MIPILYDKSETAFDSNGLGRLYDCISCTVTEERNGIYECDFEYPINGSHYQDIIIGRIIGVTHEDSNDIQPFDIVSFSKPIDGIVTFHAVHISYRQSYMTVTGSNINSLSDAFTLLDNANPSNPFHYATDKTSTGFLACADGIPRTVRQILGGIEGSILDAYGGEYEFNRWNVYLHTNRGVNRDFSIRYGVNMLDYTDETDSQGVYSSCIPYWTDGENTVVGSKTDSGYFTVTGRGECVPLDLSDKFETQPTTAQLQSAAVSYMTSNNTYSMAQNITVSFIRLQDMPEYANFSNLLSCGLCDTINVIFPDYNTQGTFKIVKTVWNVLENRFDEMELGSLSTSLAEALGISNDLDKSSGGGTTPANYVIEEGKTGDWYFRKWSNKMAECWATWTISGTFTSWSPLSYMDTNAPNNIPISGTLLSKTFAVTISGLSTWCGAISSDRSVRIFTNGTTSGTKTGTGWMRLIYLTS